MIGVLLEHDIMKQNNTPIAAEGADDLFLLLALIFIPVFLALGLIVACSGSFLIT